MSVKEKRARWLFVALLAVIAVAPTQWSIVLKGVRLSPVDLMLAVTFAAWALLALLRRVEVALPPACLWMLIGVGLLSAVNAIHPFVPAAPGYEIAGDPLKSFAEVIQLIEYLLVVYLLVWATVGNERQAQVAAAVLLGVTGLVVLGGVYHYVTRPANDVFHVSSSFENRHIYGGYLAMVLPVAFALALQASNRRARVGLLALVVVGAVTILSPGALVGLTVALLLVAARTSARALQMTLAGVLAFGALTVVALPRNYDQNFYQFVHFKTVDEQNLRAQWREWIAGAYIVQENPLLGVGPGNYQRNVANAYYSHGLEYPGKAKPGADVPNGGMEPDTYNLYAVTAASMGLLGLGALLWVLLFFGRTADAAIRRVGDAELRALAIGIWGGLIAFAVTSVFSSLLVRGTGVILALFLALAAVLRSREWAEKEQPGSRGLYVL